MPCCRNGTAPAQPKPGKPANDDSRDLPDRTGCKNHDQHGGKRDACPLPVGRERARHAPDGLRDDSHGDNFEAVYKTRAHRSLERRCAEREQHEKQGRWQRKRRPCRESAKRAAAQQSEGKADLTAGRAGQELAEGDEISIARLIDPFAARDQLVTEIAEMGDRAAE